MKNQKRILRIRPFNMANFSGAGGYLPFIGIFGTFITFPATLLLWTGFALPMKIKDGALDYSVLKRRLIGVLIILYILILLFWLFITNPQPSPDSGPFSGFMLYILLITAVHLAGMFFSISRPVKRQSYFYFSKGKWFGFTVLYALLMGVVGFFASFFLALIGG